MVIFIRLLKIISLLYEIKVLRIVIETIRNMISPLIGLIGVLSIIFYVFALIGMLIFGGKIKRDSPEIIYDTSIPNNYYLNNFNDFGTSLVTLFSLMIVNNWMI